MAPTPIFKNNNLPKPDDLGNDFSSSGNAIRTDKSLYIKTGYAFDDNEAALIRGLRVGCTAVTGNYTAATRDYIVGVTSLAIASSIGLPHPGLVGAGKIFLIKDEAGGAGTTNITIRSDGERNIDGSSSTTLSTNFQAKEFYSNGNDWYTK